MFFLQIYQHFVNDQKDKVLQLRKQKDLIISMSQTEKRTCLYVALSEHRLFGLYDKNNDCIYLFFQL